jgi:hypothetical protein
MRKTKIQVNYWLKFANMYSAISQTKRQLMNKIHNLVFIFNT